MMRIIIRFSADDAQLYRELSGHLNYEANKFTRPPYPKGPRYLEKTGTASWEGEVPDGEILAFMDTFWKRWLSTGPKQLDHFWMYADNQSEHQS